jgi:hypothetical protein
MKKLILLLSVIIISSCSERKMSTNRALRISADYQTAFSRYVSNRNERESTYYNYEPEKYLLVKHKRPDIYKTEILPYKIIWDSLKLVNELYIMSNMSVEELEAWQKNISKIKVREREDIKVKKSDNVDISTGDNYWVDSLIIKLEGQ